MSAQTADIDLDGTREILLNCSHHVYYPNLLLVYWPASDVWDCPRESHGPHFGRRRRRRPDGAQGPPRGCEQPPRDAADLRRGGGYAATTSLRHEPRAQLDAAGATVRIAAGRALAVVRLRALARAGRLLPAPRCARGGTRRRRTPARCGRAARSRSLRQPPRRSERGQRPASDQAGPAGRNRGVAGDGPAAEHAGQRPARRRACPSRRRRAAHRAAVPCHRGPRRGARSLPCRRPRRRPRAAARDAARGVVRGRCLPSRASAGAHRRSPDGSRDVALTHRAAPRPAWRLRRPAPARSRRDRAARPVHRRGDGGEGGARRGLRDRSRATSPPSSWLARISGGTRRAPWTRSSALSSTRRMATRSRASSRWRLGHAGPDDIESMRTFVANVPDAVPEGNARARRGAACRRLGGRSHRHPRSPHLHHRPRRPRGLRHPPDPRPRSRRCAPRRSSPPAAPPTPAPPPPSCCCDSPPASSRRSCAAR